MWGSLLDGSRRFFPLEQHSSRRLRTPSNAKTRSDAGGRGEAHPICYKRRDVTYRRLVFEGGAANKEVIKHLFLRRNKKERKTRARTHTFTLSLTHTLTQFGVFVLRQQKLSAALILTKIKNPPF